MKQDSEELNCKLWCSDPEVQNIKATSLDIIQGVLLVQIQEGEVR